MKRLIPLVPFVLCSVGYAFDLDISIGALRHDPSGVLEYKGDRVSVDDDLRLGKKTKPYARLRFEHGLPVLPNLYLQYMPVDFKGSNRISRNIRYGDTTFQANADISTKVELDHYDVGAYWNIGFVRSATKDVLKPELGVNLRVIDFEGKISGTELNTQRQVTESKSVTAPVPMVYGGLALNIPQVPVSLRGEVRGLPVSKVKYYDLAGEVRFKPIKPVYISVGYRYEKLKVDKISGVFTDIKIKGPFALVGAEF